MPGKEKMDIESEWWDGIMKKYEKKAWPGVVLINVLSAFTLTMATETIILVFGLGLPWGIQMLTLPQFAGMFFIFFLLSCLTSLVLGKIWHIVIGIIVSLLLLIIAASTLCWYGASKNLNYNVVDEGKKELYGGQRVMLFVPHQDDDINVLGGVLEEYVKYGSEVYVVFSTNGDYSGLAEIRLQEAIDVMAHIGVPEKNVIFLGYGDMWSPDGPHLYNADSEVIRQSHIGRTKTYGITDHEAYNEGAAYTIDNFLADIENVILQYKPDILYCVDYDYHIDHKALMHSFEKVMGKILNQDKTYRPQVLKGYAYATAWEAEPDFYAENLLATQNVFGKPHNQTPEIYRWEDRIRLPIHAESLSRSAFWSDAYATLAMYASQYAGTNATRVYNSDKVFWERSTESLCYGVQIQVSSGEAELLNDFMLLDNRNVMDEEHMPYDGVWIPETGDMQKQIHVAFPQPEAVESVVLYDHPDPEINVVNAVIVFDDGTEMETGPLHTGGAATRLQVNKTAVTSFTVTLTDLQGNAGITELEVYAAEWPPELSFVKLMDETENFVYDYWIDPSGEQDFLLYTSGAISVASEDNYTVSCDNDRCEAIWQGNRIRIVCPVGESCVVTVAGTDKGIQDTVFIQNPDQVERSWVMFCLWVEEQVWNLSSRSLLLENLVICRVYTKLPQKLAALLS